MSQEPRRFCRDDASASLILPPSGTVHHKNGTPLDWPESGTWDFGGNRYGLVEVLGFDQVVAAELLLGFGEGAIRDNSLAVTHAYRRGAGDILEAVAAEILAACRELLSELAELLHQGAGLRRGNVPPIRFLTVNQKQILHDCFLLPVSRTDARKSTGKIYLRQLPQV